MNQPGPHVAREQRTIEAMMHIYCRDHHGTERGLCDECGPFLEYARQRLDVCPFQEEKPACNHCRVHCYSESMRWRVRDVMRYAGPRMLWCHPLLSLYHLLDKWRNAPDLSGLKRRRRRRSRG